MFRHLARWCALATCCWPPAWAPTWKTACCRTRRWSGRATAKERWAAGVDTVGSTTLANVLSMTKYAGAIAACGLAGGMDLPATVAPFILRNVALLGVDSVMAPKALRIEAWNRIASELDHDTLAAMTSTIPLDQVLEAGQKIVDGKIKGRVVVEIG